ncbi:hypothetical protein SteCoe_512 [Stentor coeruleus]|uniref:chitin synthase n=1 Tax=Stentor coeruleus TaxID=5963 RepID=A0A1R2D3W8_9CILI|nr:hypothetical protein SteCoe_512 [Stentor coeruleus]
MSSDIKSSEESESFPIYSYSKPTKDSKKFPPELISVPKPSSDPSSCFVTPRVQGNCKKNNKGKGYTFTPRIQSISKNEAENSFYAFPKNKTIKNPTKNDQVNVKRKSSSRVDYTPVPNPNSSDESNFDDVSDSICDHILDYSEDDSPQISIEETKNTTENIEKNNSPTQLSQEIHINTTHSPVVIKQLPFKILSKSFDSTNNDFTLHQSIEKSKLHIPETLNQSQHYFGPALMNINFIQSPCLFRDEKTCENCNRQVIPLNKFKEKVVYQTFKLSNNREQGIRPIFADNSEEIIRCEFLNHWIDNPEKCKFLINVTMSNENCEDVWDTLQGCINNLEYFFTNEERSISPEEIGIVIIVDGIEPFLKSFYSLEGVKLYKKKCFQKNRAFFSQFFNEEIIREELITKSLVDEDPDYEFVIIRELYEAGLIDKEQEIAHIFCQKIKYLEDYYLNTVFCVKQLSKRKLNTHKWFFEGFCGRIKPKYIALLEVGVAPRTKGLFYLYKNLEKNNKIVGCCGEIIPINKNLNSIVQSQILEYKFAYIMDRALESIIGYVLTLPGSFSVYRWERLDRDDILNAYFYSERKKNEMSIFNASIHLIEDRILCTELICQKNHRNILRYVKKAKAENCVPDNLYELLIQRRRWINGLWFSMVYTMKNCNRIGNSHHSCIRKCFFKLLMIYYSIVAMFNWFMVGAFYLTFTLALKRNFNEKKNDRDQLTKCSTPIILLYTSILVVILITSLTVKPEKIKVLYKTLSFFLGLYTYASIFLILYFIFGNIDKTFFTYNPSYWIQNLSASLVFIVGVIFIIILLLNLNKSFISAIKGIPLFVFMTGTYVNMFIIYAICNINDFSCSKRQGKIIKDEKKFMYEHRHERTIWLILWIFCNGAFAYFLNFINSSGGNVSRAFIDIIALVVYFVVGVKFIGGLIYVFDEWCCCCLHKKGK